MIDLWMAASISVTLRLGIQIKFGDVSDPRFETGTDAVKHARNPFREDLTAPHRKAVLRAREPSLITQEIENDMISCFKIIANHARATVPKDIVCAI